MIPGVNITSRKASIASINGDYKEHLDCIKIDLNVAKMIIVQDYKCTKN